MSSFLPPFYDLIQEAKALESDLAQRRWVKRFCPQAIKTTAAHELDQLYHLSFLEEEDARQALVSWLEFRHRSLTRIAANPFIKRILPWRMLQELKRLRKRALALRPKSANSPPSPRPRQDPSPSTRRLGILQSSYRPYFAGQKSASTLLLESPSSHFEVTPISLAELEDEDSFSRQRVDSLLVPHASFPKATLARFASLHTQGVKLLLDDSVTWVSSESESGARVAFPKEAWFDATFTCAIDRIFPAPQASLAPSYFAPSSFGLPPSNFQLPHGNEHECAVIICSARLKDLEKLLLSYITAIEAFPSLACFLLRPPAMPDEAWNELLAAGLGILPKLQALEHDWGSSLATVKQLSLLARLDSKSDHRFGASILQKLLSLGCHVFVPEAWPLAACEEASSLARFDAAENWKAKLQDWLTSAVTRRRLGEFWLHYARATQDSWLNTQRAQLSVQAASLNSPDSSVHQLLQLSLATWKCRLPVQTAYHEVRKHVPRHAVPEISVVVTNYNYEHYILETLEALKAQSFQNFEVIVVDDRSTDGSIQVIEAWMDAHHERFAGFTLLVNEVNSGPSVARNHGIMVARSPYLFIQDADNPLESECLEKLHAALPSQAPYAFAYPTLQTFGTLNTLLSDVPWNPIALANRNSIDTMALIRASALAVIEAYRNERKGWEDYDLWCQFAFRGFIGTHVKEVLARYRAHESNLSHSHTARPEVQHQMRRIMHRDHSWIRLKL